MKRYFKGILVGIGSTIGVAIIVLLFHTFTFVNYDQPLKDSQQDTVINHIQRDKDAIRKEFHELNHNSNKRLNLTLKQLKEPLYKTQKDIEEIKKDTKSNKKILRFMMSTLKEMKKYQSVFKDDLAEKKDTILLTKKR